jgi:glucokinase
MYIGIDLGGTNIAAAVVNDKFEILEKTSIKTRAQRPAEEIVRDMGSLCLSLVEKGGFSWDDIRSVGIGTPGVVDREKGEIVYANNIPFRNMPARKILQDMLQKPIYLENDANCAALGEYMVLQQDLSCFAAVTLGTGVGSGIVIDGKIYVGSGAAVEFGHTVIEKDGILCTCGRRGCWERYASATALVEQTKAAMEAHPDTIMHEIVRKEGGKVSARTAFLAARAEDAVGRMVIQQYIEYVGLGLANLTNAFQPQVIVISGGISKEGDFLIEPLRQYVRENFYCQEAFYTEIKAATLFNDAGIIGAAFLGK